MASENPKVKETPEVQEGILHQEAGGPITSFTAHCPKHTADPSHHHKYIAVDDFSKAHLPDLPAGCPYTKEVVADYIRAHFPLVVRVHGTVVSKDRPDKREDGSAYLFADRKGKSVNHVGSGFVDIVRKTSDGWRVFFKTARHVLYDDIEAAQCRVDLFDDFDDGRGKMSISGCSMTSIKEIERDFSVSYFYTDAALGKRLQEALSYCKYLTNRLHIAHSKCCPNGSTGIVAVISHPHGRKKYLSIGRHLDVAGPCGMAVIYDTATCGGSSGGFVVDVQRPEIIYRNRSDNCLCRWTRHHPHSGEMQDGRGVSGDFNWW